MTSNQNQTGTVDVTDLLHQMKADAVAAGDDLGQWFGMTSEEQEAVLDEQRAALEANAHRAPVGTTTAVGRVTGKSFMLIEETYERSPEDEEITRTLMAQNRAKSLVNGLGSTFAKASLDEPFNDAQAALYDKLRRWAANPHNNTLVLWGTTGYGKSHTAAAAAIAATKGRSVPARIVWEDLLDAWMPDTKEVSEDQKARRDRIRTKARTTKVLVIDDLWRKAPSDHMSSEVRRLLDSRMENPDLITIVTTNIAPLDTPEGEEFVRRFPFAERVMDGLMGAINVECVGPSVRGYGSRFTL